MKPSLASGSTLDGKRHGAWTIHDDNGLVAREVHYRAGLLHGPFVAYVDGVVIERGAYDKEMRHGVWTTYYPSGAIKSTETFVRGVKHGDAAAYFESGQVRTRGAFVHGARDGKHEKFFASGALESEATHVAYRYNHSWYARMEGRELQLFESGRISIDRTYVRGELHGKAISNNEDSRDHERDMVFGVRHGLDRDWDGEVLTETRYIHGVPEDKAKPKQLASLAAKLKNKKKDRDEKSDILREITDGQPETGRFLWHLLREELITGAELEALWEDMAEDAAATGADVVLLLSTLKPKFGEDAFMFMFWPDALDKLVCRIYDRDPAPIDAALPKLPKHLRDAVRSVRVRFGHREKFDVDIAAFLAKAHAVDGIGTCCGGVRGAGREVFWKRDGVLDEVSLSSTADSDIPNEAFFEFIELFTTREAYAKALLGVALKASDALATHRVAEALRIATPAQFGKLLANGAVRSGDLAFVLTRLRTDPAATLLGWAKKSESDEVREILALVAADRFAREGQAISSDVDELLVGGCLEKTREPWSALASAVSRRSRDNSYLVWTEQMAEELVAAMRFGDAQALLPEPFALYRSVLGHLPRDRARAIVAKMFADPQYGTRNAIPLSADVATPELVTEIVAYIEASKPTQYSPRLEWSLGLAALPTEWTLSAIQAAAKRAPKDARSFWHLALLCTLAAAADRGESWPVALDEQLSFGPFGKKDEAMPESHANAMRKIMRALPLERAQPIFDRAFAQKPEVAVRAFVAIAAHPVESVLRPAFELLLAPKVQLGGAKTYVSFALAELRELGAYWARWVLAKRTTPSDDVRSAFDLALDATFWAAYDASTSGDDDGDDDDDDDRCADVAKLAQMLAAFPQKRPTTRPIYALVRCDEPVAGTYNQIGGVPRGLTAETWPMTEDDEPMQFVCMLDLETVPATRDANALGHIRAVALFISSAAHNKAYTSDTDETRSLELTAAQLEHAGVAPAGAKSLDHAGFTVTALDVPTAIFEEIKDDEDDDEDGDEDGDEASVTDQLKAIRHEVYTLSARAGGEPIWLQGAEYGDRFLLQLDEGFVPGLNLGDAGVMYVFASTAFWQCH